MIGLRGSLLLTAAALVSFAGGASAQSQTYEFDFPAQPLAQSLSGFAQASGQQIIFTREVVDNLQAPALHGAYTPDAALGKILNGTHLIAERTPSGALMIEHARPVTAPQTLTRTADAAPAHAATSVETVVVTSSKIKGDIQTVPIAITALSQEQLTTRQIAGGPDLVKEVPNLTFTKTNFTGYSIQIRGIGTQAISVSTDPAVAVAFNDIPFIRNHFFEQEFYDVGQVEVVRGPQGTLYGRNATAGVVNVISAKPTDQFEAMASADWGNYTNRRYEGMVNIPIVDDRLDLRVAGEWTKRDGYSINENTGQNIDGRDLWSTRVTLGWKPTENLQTYLVWEHFSEDDDRLRTSKQLCKTAPNPAYIGGVAVPAPGIAHGGGATVYDPTYYLSQGCELVSLYDKGHPNAATPDYGAFGVPNGLSLPYASAIGILSSGIRQNFNPYATTVQSTNLRAIDSTLTPKYRAKNDVVEFNADYTLSPALTVTSQTGFGQDFLWSTEDYNRFNTAPGVFLYNTPAGRYSTNANGAIMPDPLAGTNGIPANSGAFCDPQLGCTDKIVGADLSEEHAWQLSQEFRLATSFKGPLNFSVGGNYLHYETEENYYVFINTLTMVAASPEPGVGPSGSVPWVPGVSDNHECLTGGFRYSDPTKLYNPQSQSCSYIDPNPITSLNGDGHNYFRSKNPYVLNSYATFGEAYYDILSNLKLTGGVRWTDDQKHFIDIPSEVEVGGYGYAATGVVDQVWNELTGRTVLDWTPKLDFTDQTLVYGSYAHGYKAGGANPPGAVFLALGGSARGVNPIHSLTFKPEFVDAYELGTKNTLLDGGLTLNGDVFFYNYKGYQISRIVDRTAINDNFDATVKGAELEARYEPLPGLKFNFAGGYESTRIKNGQQSIDLMDRAAGDPNWYVLKTFPTQASNCILPATEVGWLILESEQSGPAIPEACMNAFGAGNDPLTALPYVAYPAVANNVGGTVPAGYPGFDPKTVPNNGEGIDKDLSGNQLPNAPHFTTSFSAEYTLPLSEDWAATLHGDFYWQSQSFARVFNDRPYDKLRGYSTTNVALILTSAGGWQVLGYVKNVFDVTAITGDFLNSDDSGLTTNVFLTDPRLFGVRVTKNW